MPKPKLPPVPKPGDGTIAGDILSEIKKIHASGGKPIDASMLPRGNIKRGTPSHCLERRGRIVFRVPGKAGADSPYPIDGLEFIRSEQQYLANINKLLKNVIPIKKERFSKAGKTPRKASVAREAAVRELVNQLKCEEVNLVTVIARKLAMKPDTVRKILRKNKIQWRDFQKNATEQKG